MARSKLKPQALADGTIAVLPTCKVKRTADQVINISTDTIVNWDAEEIDNSSMHDNVTNNSRITVPSDGIYLLTTQVKFASNSTGFRYAGFKENGSFVNLSFAPVAPVTGQVTAIAISTILALSANDYLEVNVYQTGASTLNLVGGTVTFGSFFSVHKISN